MTGPARARGRGGRGRGSRGGRGGAGAAGTKRVVPPSPTQSDYEDGPPAKKPRPSTIKKTTVVDPPVAPSPIAPTPLTAPIARERRSRAGVNMGVLIEAIKPRGKRTSAQVDADNEAAVEAVSQRQRQHNDSVDGVADLYAQEDEALADEDADAVYTLGDLANEAPCHEDDMLSITDDDFDRLEDDEAYQSSSEFEDPKPKARRPAAPKKMKKPQKLETRKAIEAAAQAKLVANGKKKAETVVVQKKGVQNSNAAAASSKAGLSKTWNTKPVTSAADTTLGGLDDEDAAATRPAFPKPNLKSGNPRAPRKNNLVGFIDLSSEADNTPSKVPGRATNINPTRKPRLAVKVETTKIPALTAVKSKTPKIKAESSSSSSFTPPSAADINGLPAFIGRTWATRFLPAAYRLLLKLDDPMFLGVVGDDPEVPGKESVVILQNLVNELYPDVQYNVEWGDAICARFVARIGERRSAIGKSGVQVVDNGFEGLKYYADLASDTPAARLISVIADDAKYALRSNGPAFYKVATPKEKPTGFLESKAVISTIAPFIQGHEWKINVSYDHDGNEVLDYSELPVGLLGMGAAAVERAYKLHLTGVRSAKPRDFSAANYATAVAGFVKSIKKFKASRWESILRACGVTPSELTAEEDAPVEEASLDGVREHMYIPSSP
ncbi:hypothetical protein B0H12DRAFT_1075397 [Mycena haematopus]|nr:hypothetical protein B0H12DRAFT_1075397 [Mycena haematopus]